MFASALCADAGRPPWVRGLFGVLLVVVSTLLTGACSVIGIRSGTEQPSYTVVETLADDIEIRRYAARLAADVIVGGEEAEARTAGFRILAAYIFGDNRSGPPIAMTAPVAQATETSETIAMTAPVTQVAADEGRWRVRFFMPSAYTVDTLPVPTDPAIRIVEVPPTEVAVLRFSGSRRPSAVHRASERLSEALAGTRWRPVGAPEALFYDPPWTLPFLRRNEVAIAVTATSDRS